MELEDLKFLPKSKRLLMAQCAAMMVFADGKQEESELEALGVISLEVLNITIQELLDSDFANDKVIANLKLLSDDEFVFLGAFLGYVAQSDGHIAVEELVFFRSLLAQGGLNSSIIDGMILNILK
jgi:uncharacterized tellurite resistance protein B-like protein